MTHFCVLLITDEKHDMDGLCDVLWPWDFENQNSKDPRFDFFKIGGRFQAVLDPHFDADASPPPLVSSQMQKKCLAIEALEARKIAYFASLYDKVHAAIGDLPLPDLPLCAKSTASGIGLRTSMQILQSWRRAKRNLIFIFTARR